MAKLFFSSVLLMVLCLAISESRYHGKKKTSDSFPGLPWLADDDTESTLINKIRSLLKSLKRENQAYIETKSVGDDGDDDDWEDLWDDSWVEWKEGECVLGRDTLEDENDDAATRVEWGDGLEHQPCQNWMNAKWLKGDRKDKHIRNSASENFRKKNFKRNFVKYATLWPKAKIPYTVVGDSAFQNSIGQRIKEAADLFKRETCVQWVDKTTNANIQSEVGHSNYVKVTSAEGCDSAVGRITTNNDGQVIGMNMEDCNTLHTALHEMCHAMGMDHEQSRYDRGNYIKVNLDKLEEGYWNNYDRENSYDRTKYDLGSVLQYSDGGEEQEMTVAVQALAFLTHLDKSLSHYDIQEINQAYKCTDHCTNKPTCLNSGFVNQNCVCKCPKGLKGDVCQDVDKGEPGKECGDVIEFTSTGVQTITSPNYQGDYGAGRKCVWLVKAPKGYRLKATLKDLDLPYDMDNKRCFHYVEIQFNLLGEIGVRKCAKLAASVTREYKTSLYEEPNSMMIKFDSTKTATAGKGFKIEVEALNTGCTNFPCKQGSTCEDRPDGGYFCKCLEGFTGAHCDEVQDKTVGCDFKWDLSQGCILKTPERTNFEWNIMSKTKSHSETLKQIQATTKKFFASLYDNTGTSQGGEKAILSTAGVKFDERDRCLSFKYYVSGGANGGSTGGIKIFYSGSGADWSELWSSSVTNAWQSEQMNVPKVQGLEIEIEGTYGDRIVAIDDVQVSAGKCTT